MASYTTLANILTNVRFRGAFTSAQLSESDGTPTQQLLIANKIHREMVMKMIQMNEDYFREILTFDLVDDQREYTIPQDTGADDISGGAAIKIKGIEIRYDGANFVKAHRTHTTDIPIDDIDNITDKARPLFILLDDGFQIFPKASSAEGDSVGAGNGNGKVHAIVRQGELTGTTSIPKILKEHFGVFENGMLADIYEGFGALEKSELARRRYNEGLREMVGEIAHRDKDEFYQFQRVETDYS